MKKIVLAACLAAFANVSAAEGDAKRGEALYQVYCTQCHGVEGNGKGVNAAYMAVMPRDHTDTKEMGARTDEELFKVVKLGGKSFLSQPGYFVINSPLIIHRLINLFVTLFYKSCFKHAFK